MANDPKQVPQAVVDALMRGDKMGAIKLLRESTGGDLRGAMEIVQRLMAHPPAAGNKGGGGHGGGGQHPRETPSQTAEREKVQALMSAQRTPTVMPGDHGGRGLAWLLLVAMFAAAGWVLFGP